MDHIFCEWSFCVFFEGSERSSIACIGDKIYYRSNNIAPASLIVLSTQTLTEIGHVLRNGKGTYPTADNTGKASFGTEHVSDKKGKTDGETENKEEKKVDPIEQMRFVS